MKIRHQLLGGYLLVAMASVVVGYIGSMTTPLVTLAFDRLSTESLPIIGSLEDIQFSGLRVVASTSEYGFIIAERNAQRNALIDADKKHVNNNVEIAQADENEAGEVREVESAKEQLMVAIGRYGSLVSMNSPEQHKYLSTIKQLAMQLTKTADDLIEYKHKGIFGDPILAMKAQFEITEKQFLQRVQQTIDYEHQQLDIRSSEVHQSIVTGNYILWAAGGLAILLASLIGKIVSNAIVIPIERLKIAAKSIGEGQLQTRIELNAMDEFEPLGLAFNKMAKDLNDSRLDLANTQSQLVQSAKLASIGEMATGVAHELNQPLGIIAMNSDFQINEIREGRFNDTEEAFQLIVKQVERTTVIIDHLRIFGRESNNTSYVPTDINSLIEDAFIMFNEQLRLHDIKVIKQLGQHLPKVNCNHIRLEQVLINLIANARDAMADASFRHLTLVTSSDKGKVIIDISDTGCGIAPDNIDKIFDPFFTTKDVGKGTGLGLSISFGIVKDHGGNLKVKSTLEKGSTFSVELTSVTEALS